MERNSGHLIHQTLHGYSDGHSLLGASCELSAIEKITLLRMSDLSGSTSGIEFAPYLTGYPIPESNFYAFARTWNASEMSRPGSVWTHTLLIRFPILSGLKNFAGLLSLFKRPNKDFKNYTLPISEYFENADFTTFDRTKFDELTYLLYEKADKTILLFNESNDIETNVLQIWKYQWPRLRRSFSFCTGSFSIRYLSNSPIDLQIVPRQSDISINTQVEKTEFEIIRKIKYHDWQDGDWMSLFKEANLEDLLSFMFKYGSDIEGSRQKYISLFLAYIFDQQNYFQNNQLVNLMYFFKEHFPSKSEGNSLKRDFLLKLFEQDRKNIYYFLVQRFNGDVENDPFRELHLNYSEVILDLWNRKNISKIELTNIINRLDFNLLGDRLNMLFGTVPVDSWMNSDWITAELIADVVKANPNISSNPIIWSYRNKSQRTWYMCLKFLEDHSEQNRVLSDFIAGMLSERNDAFANDVIEDYKPRSVGILLNCLDASNIRLSPVWENLLLHYPVLILRFIESSQSSPSKLSLLNSILGKYPDHLRNSKFDWSKLIGRLKKEKPSSLKIALFSKFLALSFNNAFDRNSEETCSLVFQEIHNEAANGNIEDESWRLIKDSIPSIKITSPERNLLSKVFGLNEDHVPYWDRCEILRRALVECFILYNWRVDVFLSAIQDVTTLERIMIYCFKSTAGINFIISVRNSKSISKFPKLMKALKKFKVNKR